MELRQLRYFIALAEELHFGRAAERLFISQPPLSQQIRALEEELQVQLFLRSSRRVQMTDAGRAFLDKARVVMLSLSSAVEAAHGARDGSMGRLQIGYIHSASHTLLPVIVRACSQKLPKLKLQLHELDVERQIDAIVAERIDVGLIRLPTLHPGVSSQRLMTESFMLALPEKHHLAKKTKVEVRGLVGQPLIGYPGARGEGTFQRALLELCASEHLVPEFSQEASTVQTALGLVRAGVGLAIVPCSLRSLRLDGVIYREFIGQTPKVSMGVAWREERKSSLIESFVRIATQAIANVRGLGE